MCESSQKVQIPIRYKVLVIIEVWGSNIPHGDCNYPHCTVYLRVAKSVNLKRSCLSLSLSHTHTHKTSHHEVVGDNQTQCGDHLTKRERACSLLSCVQLCETPWTTGSYVHTNIKSLCCAPETNIKLYTTYTSVKKTKNIELAEQNKQH